MSCVLKSVISVYFFIILEFTFPRSNEKIKTFLFSKYKIVFIDNDGEQRQTKERVKMNTTKTCTPIYIIATSSEKEGQTSTLYGYHSWPFGCDRQHSSRLSTGERGWAFITSQPAVGQVGVVVVCQNLAASRCVHLASHCAVDSFLEAAALRFGDPGGPRPSECFERNL